MREAWPLREYPLAHHLNESNPPFAKKGEQDVELQRSVGFVLAVVEKGAFMDVPEIRLSE